MFMHICVCVYTCVDVHALIKHILTCNMHTPMQLIATYMHTYMQEYAQIC